MHKSSNRYGPPPFREEGKTPRRCHTIDRTTCPPPFREEGKARALRLYNRSPHLPHFGRPPPPHPSLPASIVSNSPRGGWRRPKLRALAASTESEIGRFFELDPLGKMVRWGGGSRMGREGVRSNNRIGNSYLVNNKIL